MGRSDWCDDCRRGEHDRCLTAMPGESNWPDPECKCRGECARQRTRLREGALTPARTPCRPPAPATLVPLARDEHTPRGQFGGQR